MELSRSTMMAQVWVGRPDIGEDGAIEGDDPGRKKAATSKGEASASSHAGLGATAFVVIKALAGTAPWLHRCIFSMSCALSGVGWTKRNVRHDAQNGYRVAGTVQ